MEKLTEWTGVVAPLNRQNVDTDQIIPKQFLKRIERTGFGEFLFFDWRYRPDGSPDPQFELNRPGYEGASILVAGRNFGCGSSREHAPWALMDYGIRVILAPSYADIFYNNCFKNGMLPIVLPEPQVQQIMERAEKNPGYQLTVSLVENQIRDANGLSIPFEVDPFRRYCLMNGLDDIGLTLQHDAAIASYEAARAAWLPRL